MGDPRYLHIGSVETRLIEECSELIKAVCKAQRFGWDNHPPGFHGLTNRNAILDEMQDVRRAMAELEERLLKEIKDG